MTRADLRPIPIPSQVQAASSCICRGLIEIEIRVFVSKALADDNKTTFAPSTTAC